MVQFPNCKINIGLNIVAKRTDGYHDLETVFYPVAIKDALEVIRSTETTFQVSGLAVAGNEEDNLCLKAYRLLKQDFPELPQVSIHLLKAIPMGAGLGGGSSNGAFMLSMLNKKFQLQLTNEQLINYALQLGSDCPFFIINSPCFATGRGEKLTPVHVDLSAYRLVVVNPGIHVSTKEAFSKLTPKTPAKPVQEAIEQPVDTWRKNIVNDFEEAVFRLYPEIKEIKTTLYSAGAIYASMTGTGSTVFALFEASSIPDFLFPGHYYIKVI